ncbi:C6 transcription factor [Rasamsonia emersonii CBS 393.64]|uniref:C6 transcription factor n=1 Tax=Rasamsonia emersonii (strain ATCC 16479 / CBS 393.64 / IMI 116815) TaxID=1408163 RepID=A0A0F4YWR5_RASE3|nr:C6 transcription factor [Rasamsonia emersonii CBS 393.64]KKA22078.1 C6 transcription factor [Rasamsonia emersonii CBS 393.64]
MSNGKIPAPTVPVGMHRLSAPDALVPVCGRCQASGEDFQTPPSEESNGMLVDDLSPAWLDSAVSLPADLGIPASFAPDASSIASAGHELFDFGLINPLAALLPELPPCPSHRPAAEGSPQCSVVSVSGHAVHWRSLPLRRVCPRCVERRCICRPVRTADPRNGFTVQSMLLLAIVTHAHGREDEANQILRSAVDLALELGMDRAAFARENSMGSSLWEESWRRTYWELYIVDGLFAGLREQSTFSLYGRPSDLSLPCEEEEYHAGNVPPMQYTLEDFRQNWSLHPNGKRFSSFAYRVEAVRILGMVPGLSQSTEVDSEPQAETIDACLAGWFLHLPASKRDPMLSNGRVDEMLFQGQILSTCTQPRHNNRNNPPPPHPVHHALRILPHPDILHTLPRLPTALDLGRAGPVVEEADSRSRSALQPGGPPNRDQATQSLPDLRGGHGRDRAHGSLCDGVGHRACRVYRSQDPAGCGSVQSAGGMLAVG